MAEEGICSTARQPRDASPKPERNFILTLFSLAVLFLRYLSLTIHNSDKSWIRAKFEGKIRIYTKFCIGVRELMLGSKERI
jgi:hypothetical protein